MNPTASDESPDEIGTFAPFGEFDESLDSAESIGVDSGATLVKLCVRRSGGDLHFGTWPSPSRDRVLGLLDALAPERVGITGCGSRGVIGGLGRKTANPIEFDAWGYGANHMLEQLGTLGEAPYLLVSVGTGTSALRVEGDRVERVGGTALGGGPALGLGLALTNSRSHAELTALAARGDRGRVDLLISDIYPDGEIPLAAEATAASFGKLVRSPDETPRPEDLAAAVMALVAENIALLSTAQARVAGVSRIVYGGSTLVDNARVADTVRLLGAVMGFESIVLPRGGHVGALGSMLLGA